RPAIDARQKMAVLIGAFELGYIKGLRRSDKDTDLGLSCLSGAQGVSATSMASIVRSISGCSSMTARERKARSLSEPRTLRFAVAPVATLVISRASWSSDAGETPMHRRTAWTAA